MCSTRSLSTLALGLVVSLFILPLVVSLPAQAGVEFFEVDADPGGWLEALAAAGAVPDTIVDFGLLADFGGPGHSDPPDGPLCVEGNDIVPFGFVPLDLCLSTPDMDHLDYVGGFSGFGNPKNAVVAGFLSDSFDIEVSEPKIAFEIFALSFIGGDGVNFTVFDPDGIQLGHLPGAGTGGTSGGRWGVLATEGDAIGRVNITDPDGGAEGIMDLMLYVLDPNACPEDLDHDTNVGAGDLAILLGAWGPNPDHPADFNSDDVVNAADLAILIGSWGPCP